MTAAVARDLSAFVAPGEDDRGRLELLVRGARCGACLARIEKTAREAPGVEAARFNLTTGKLAVTFAGPTGDAAAVIDALDGAGYPATPFDPAQSIRDEDREGRALALALGVAGFGAGNVMMFTVPVWAGLFDQELTPATREVMYWFAAAVATPCALFAGMPFFRSAWQSLRRRRANMDVPISIGVLLTLIVSFSETFLQGRHAYFDAAVTLLFLLLIGRYLDHKLRVRARGAARDLLALQAPVATLLGLDGLERLIPVGEVEVGDALAVAPGDRIPVNALVESGASEIDNALISGETAPVTVRRGSVVHAGALNLNGRLVLRAQARSEDSAVAEIARMMEAGAQSKSSYVRLADRAAALYVPVVHTIALLTFVGVWAIGLGPREALLRAAAVLIVTCPCALGLAVPAVQIVASGRLFRRGILVKSGAALERLAEVDHVVFDKTGVLTEGKPRLKPTSDAVVRAAAPLARASRHPLARALAEAAGIGEVATEVLETPGMGVEGVINGRRARLGRATYVGVDSRRSDDTELWFGFDSDVRVRFAFEDAVRDDAAEAVAMLEDLGLRIEVVSGDVLEPVERAALSAGIGQVLSGVTPIEKVARIEALQAEGRKVLMVGDGLNDAAALAKAHASMAPGSAVDASQNAADLVFSGGALAAIPESIRLARVARRRVMENFAFSALYNLIAAPAAMLGLINPFVAAIAMSGSSLVVILNALRLGVGDRR